MTSALSIGIDFGTTNTVVAVAGADGRAEAVTFRHGEVTLKGFVTALCYWQERQGGRVTTRVDGGPFAMDQLMAGGGPQRFIQSFKSFAASPSFQETRIFGRTTRFEDLLVDFIGTLRRHAGDGLDLSDTRVQIGRPVRFAGANPDEDLAMARYREGFGRLGLGEARYVYEPVGAAFFYARALDHDSTVLVADFGGGTSDFSVMRFERNGGRLTATPLSHAGIGIAGDSFDYRIVDRMVSPALGKGSSYRSMDKVLAVPNRYYANLARWHQLALMKSNGDLAGLRDLEKVAVEPEKLRRFIDVVDYDLGLALYRAVSEAKMALSAAEEADFRFVADDVAVTGRIARADFESWIAEDVARIGATVDEALARAGIGEDAIDRVFLTGGTSFVPAIRRLFTARFDEAKLTQADQFESIAYGLALIGQEPDAARWAA